MNKGIVFIALGEPQYGKMAANAAASIRVADKAVNIHLVYQGKSISHLTEKHKALFTSMAECPPEYYTKNGKEVFLKAKTHIYDLSPFDVTILLDADLITFGRKPISLLFDELQHIDFTMQNRGFADLSAAKLNSKFSLWADINEVKEQYNTTGRFYHLASEFIYFKRSDENEKYFALVKEIFKAPKVKAMAFGNDIPDELAFDIATAVMGKYPHRDNYVPVYWFAADKTKEWKDILTTHYGYSIGGNLMPENVLYRYHQLARAQARNLQLPFHYKVYAKKKWNAERKTI